MPGALDDTERALYYRLVQGISQLADDPRWKAIMKDAKIAKDAADRALRDLLASLPPEVRLAGLDPQVRLAGLAAEDLLLALPDEALHTLGESYLATLPEHVRARIRARLAR